MFLMSFFFLLLGRGETVFTPNSNNIIISFAQYHQNNKQNDIANDNQTITLIEDTDIDLEEDNHNSDNFKSKKNCKLNNQKFSLIQAKFSRNFRDIISNKKAKQFEICLNKCVGNTTPIYLLNSVFII